jgi:hypothetical protein
MKIPAADPAACYRAALMRMLHRYGPIWLDPEDVERLAAVPIQVRTADGEQWEPPGRVCVEVAP